MPSPTTNAATVTADATLLLFVWLLLSLWEREASPSAFSVPAEPSLEPPSSEVSEASSEDSLSLELEWLAPSSLEPLDSDWLECSLEPLDSSLEPLDSEWVELSSPEPLDSDWLEPSSLDAPDSEPSDEAPDSEPSDEAPDSEPSEALIPPPGPRAPGALHPETVITTAMHSARFTDFFVFIERIPRCPSVPPRAGHRTVLSFD
ncbi:hypothetical protein LILAB_12035 [Corallococcus macrosporus]|uniref:Uncharacterized protein n=1 Tax=Myxococcus fulvus (strain ATCC BAA-855 / HW-1) TaxID=483219 RepID=F8C6C6_MYXFH|nr:hypothetical protein LILAB_12035 [Corallococcus macrosporus]